jgi:predicted metal-binding protein
MPLTNGRQSDGSGRRQTALTREPGDLPSHGSCAGRGASATVEPSSTVLKGRHAPIFWAGSAPQAESSKGHMRMSEIGATPKSTVLVCITCRAAADPVEAPRAGLALAEATASAAADATDILVQRIRCLGNCSRACSAAIRSDSAWTYVFGGLDASRDGESLIAGARLLAQTPDGIMPWRGRPEALKRGLIARIPPTDFCEEPS